MEIRRRNCRYSAGLCLLFLAVYFFFNGHDLSINNEGLKQKTVVNSKYLEASEPSAGLKNYLMIKKLFWYWQNGPSFTKRIYKRELQMYLSEIIGRDIDTDRSYKIQSPGDLADKKVECNFIDCRWLHFHGAVNVDNIKDIVVKDPLLLKKWWRSDYFFSVSGKVKKFRFGRDTYGDTVEIFLDKIILRAAD